MSWSERLMRTLDEVPYDVILYMQEDYFIKADVDAELVHTLATLMLRDNISHISLERTRDSEGRATRYPYLTEIGRRAEWRVNAQAGLWHVDSLRSYLRRHETVWELEWYGTRRAWRRKDLFLYVNQHYRDDHDGLNPVPYDGTGVVHGMWDRAVVVDLFEDHNIDMDFSRRGFYDEGGVPRHRGPLLRRAVRRLRSFA
jgi:hypothetical protein